MGGSSLAIVRRAAWLARMVYDGAGSKAVLLSRDSAAKKTSLCVYLLHRNFYDAVHWLAAL